MDMTKNFLFSRRYIFGGTIGKSSEITISLNFTAEHAENAEAPENQSED